MSAFINFIHSHEARLLKEQIFVRVYQIGFICSIRLFFSIFFAISRVFSRHRYSVLTIILTGLLFSASKSYGNLVVTKDNIDRYIGQLFFVGVVFESEKERLELLSKLISKYKVGGVIFYGNWVTAEEELNEELYVNSIMAKNRQINMVAAGANLDIPLFIGLDQESGKFVHVRKGVIQLPPAMGLSVLRSSNLVYDLNHFLSDQLIELGFHINFSPVVDLSLNRNNSTVYYRSWSSDPVLVKKMAEQVIKAQWDAGLLSVIKHFPGFGNTNKGPNDVLPSSYSDCSTINSELQPYRDLSKSAPIIMSSHIQWDFFAGTDKSYYVPASLNRDVVTKLLKKKVSIECPNGPPIIGIGYTGMVIMDDIGVYSLRHRGKGVLQKSYGEIAEKALVAGNDMLMACHIYDAHRPKKKEGVPRDYLSLLEFDKVYHVVESYCNSGGFVRCKEAIQHVVGLKERSSKIRQVEFSPKGWMRDGTYRKYERKFKSRRHYFWQFENEMRAKTIVIAQKKDGNFGSEYPLSQKKCGSTLVVSGYFSKDYVTDYLKEDGKCSVEVVSFLATNFKHEYREAKKKEIERILEKKRNIIFLSENGRQTEVFNEMLEEAPNNLESTLVSITPPFDLPEQIKLDSTIVFAPDNSEQGSKILLSVLRGDEQGYSEAKYLPVALSINEKVDLTVDRDYKLLFDVKEVKGVEPPLQPPTTSRFHVMIRLIGRSGKALIFIIVTLMVEGIIVSFIPDLASWVRDHRVKAVAITVDLLIISVAISECM